MLGQYSDLVGDGLYEDRTGWRGPVRQRTHLESKKEW